MGKFKEKLGYYWNEFRRRKIFRTAAAYAIIFVAILGPASDILSGLEAPGWILRYLIIALIAGFPIALVVSWYFDFTFHGFERTEDRPMDESDPGGDVQGASTDNNGEDRALTDQGPRSSVQIEEGDSHRYQITFLRCSFVLCRDNRIVDDPEVLNTLLPDLEKGADAICEQFTAQLHQQDGANFELLFGYPMAYENDAIRAVAAGQALVELGKQLTAARPGKTGLSLAALVAIHSNEVVIRNEDGDPDTFTLAGVAPQITTWIQALGMPGTILLDKETHALLRNRFECEHLGEHTNRQHGFRTAVFQALRQRQPDGNLQYSEQHDRLFLGRDSEISIIMDRWETTRDGEDAFIVLRGEPGIGKSTLLGEITRRIQAMENSLVVPLFCSSLGRSSALHPIREHLLGLAGSDNRSLSAEQVQVLRERWLAFGIVQEKIDRLLALMFSADESAAMTEQARTEMLTLLLDFLITTARNKALLLIIEDLHWADPTTMEVVSMLVSRGSNTGLMCIFTTRPHLKLDWEGRSNITTLNLSKLSRRSSRDLVVHTLKGLELPNDIVDQIVSEAGGNPLFAEELTKAIYETATSNPDYQVQNLVLPGTLQRSLASRIDNLGSAKPLLQLSSLLGRKFDYSLLKAVSQTQDEHMLQNELRLLVNAEFFFQEGGVPHSTYTFKHALMQETAYQSMLKSTRIELHKRVAAVIESEFGDRAASTPELLALHYQESEQTAKAISLWTLACNKSLNRYAIKEAVELAENGLQLVPQLEKSKPRDLQEIALLAMHGKALLSIRGYADPKVEETFTRALELCDSVGDVPQLFQMMVGLWAFFQIGGSTLAALRLGEQLLERAREDDSPAKTTQALYCMGFAKYRHGDYSEAEQYLEQALETSRQDDDYSRYTPNGDDLRINVRYVLAHICFHRGRKQYALDLKKEGLALSHEIGNPLGIVFAIHMSTWLMKLFGMADEAAGYGKEAVDLAGKLNLNHWRISADYLYHWALYEQAPKGDRDVLEQAIHAMEEKLETYLGIGARHGATSMAQDLAEAYAGIGDVGKAEKWLSLSREIIESLDEYFFKSELYRVEGLIMKTRGDYAGALELLNRAEAMARDMGSFGLMASSARDKIMMYQEMGDTKSGKLHARIINDEIRDKNLDMALLSETS